MNSIADLLPIAAQRQIIARFHACSRFLGRLLWPRLLSSLKATEAELLHCLCKPLVVETGTGLPCCRVEALTWEH